MEKHYHGGRGGMRKGQIILPPSVTKATSSASFGNTVTDNSKVYVTTNFSAAVMYASGLKNGAVYEVLPKSRLISDPDCLEPGLSYMCDRAVIIKSHKISKNQQKLVLDALIAS